MNKLIRTFLIITAFLCGVFISCSQSTNNNKENSSGYVGENEAEGEADLLPDTAAIIELMEYYQNVDTAETNKRFETYRELLESQDNYNPEDIDWYFKNISHIDSVSKQAVILTKQEQYKDLAYLLDSELRNYYGHPKSDSYSIYKLSLMMLPLYKMISPNDKAYYSKLIEMWEVNKLMIEAVQFQTGEQHPYYDRMLHELSYMYEKVGAVEKKKEVDAIISKL